MVCYLCSDKRVLCPGCTQGKIPSNLFMGCGVLIRCPECVGYDKAMEDKIFMKRTYWPPKDSDSSEYAEYEKGQNFDKMEKELDKQFPDENITL